MTLTEKIARLVAERGWNQEEFARQAKLNRNTARQILTRPAKKLHNQTVRQIADSLGLSVHELTEQPLERLAVRIRDGEAAVRSEARHVEMATQPELQAWMATNSQRAKALNEEEVDELLSLQGTGGPLTPMGVEHFVNLIERKRALKQKVESIAGTGYLPFLEKMVELMYEKIQPYRDRVEKK